jgi:hypothetical protein
MLECNPLSHRFHGLVVDDAAFTHSTCSRNRRPPRAHQLVPRFLIDPSTSMTWIQELADDST